MTRLELAKLQLSRASRPKNFLGDDWLFFWSIATREKQKLSDIIAFELEARRWVPFWERYQLEEAYAPSLSERALEVRGPRNEDPICECYSVSGDNPYCKWHNEDPMGSPSVPIGGSIQEWMGDFVPRYLSTGERWDDELNCYVKGETP